MLEATLAFSLLYTAGKIVVVVLAVLALWRIVKAQEATAAAMQQIANTVSRFGPPA
jgi:hypothetical protein